MLVDEGEGVFVGEGVACIEEEGVGGSGSGDAFIHGVVNAVIGGALPEGGLGF